MPVTNKTRILPQWLLRRRAVRSLNLLARKGATNQAFARYQASLPATVAVFREKRLALKLLRRASRERRKELQETERLRRSTEHCADRVCHELPNLDPFEFTIWGDSPKETIEQATYLVQFLERRQAKRPIACGDEILATLVPSLAIARQQFSVWQDALARTREGRAHYREVAYALQLQLRAFRLSVRAVFGLGYRY